ncbi:hypothetical protein BU24DRAFT_422223 [Aaosphaeria arxii CBS 175.79]|uniref:Oxidoreductase acuF-like C2H2 type zinc-finger domain-containing protein n=1 Tax=Aaosphaeria arxii CBS 175.79 TaxID=1450172 RepID=A0A6A5XRU9_9PLEO|nr:uncharacterized protein BU24DRAFT_422223 [Aaosphaeria arxii CBS 175.79]KAF2015912.1 hypothetical protein BU24DRAFT_422223 [Aaosphaeria arxii CBS 175.79]
MPERAGYSDVPSSISTIYNSCLAHFRHLLFELSNDPRLTSSGLSRSLELYGRLRAWGEETRAMLPPSSRGSLEDTLRKNESTKEVAVDILTKLERQLRTAVELSQNQWRGAAAVSQPDYETYDGDETISLSSDSSDDNESVPAKSPRLNSVLRHIADDVDSLYQLSHLIIRPGFIRKYLHSTRGKDFDARVAPFYQYDIRHVEEKFQEWRQSKKGLDERELVTTPDVIVGRSAGSEPILIQRLALANTKRREQLLYWSRHPDRVESELDLAMDKSSVQHPTDSGSIQRDRTETESQYSKSIKTRHTFSNIAASDIFGKQTVAGTLYAETNVGNKRLNRVPPVPSSSRVVPSFECPYCHSMLDSQVMQSRQEWKKHIFRDLRPYVCTFESCSDPDKQYSTRRDWIYHEIQVHRRQWVCDEHDLKFESKALFSRHVVDRHSVIAAEQLPVLIDISERPLDGLDIVSCPLCPEKRRLMLLEPHIAEHLESIALFALSRDVEEDGGEDAQHVNSDWSSSTIDDPIELSVKGDDDDGENHDQHINSDVNVPIVFDPIDSKEQKDEDHSIDPSLFTVENSAPTYNKPESAQPIPPVVPAALSSKTFQQPMRIDISKVHETERIHDYQQQFPSNQIHDSQETADRDWAAGWSNLVPASQNRKIPTPPISTCFVVVV